MTDIPEMCVNCKYCDPTAVIEPYGYVAICKLSHMECFQIMEYITECDKKEIVIDVFDTVRHGQI